MKIMMQPCLAGAPLRQRVCANAVSRAASCAEGLSQRAIRLDMYRVRAIDLVLNVVCGTRICCFAPCPRDCPHGRLGKTDACGMHRPYLVLVNPLNFIQTNRQTDKLTNRQPNKQTNNQTNKHIIYKGTYWETDMEIHKNV